LVEPKPENTMMLRTVLILAGALALGSCGGGPQRPSPQVGGAPAASRVVAPEALLFLDFDADHDRRIERAEVQRGIDAAWADLAKGGATIGQIALRDWLDRALGTDEFDFNPVFFDSNLDGRIDKAEFANGLNSRFTALDRDNDGVLTRAELSHRTLAPERGRAGGEGQRAGGSNGGQGAGREGGQGGGQGRGEPPSR
jgi:EF hand